MSLFFGGRPEKRAMDASWFGTDTFDPYSIRPDTAPTLAPVFAAIRHIVDYVSTLPVDTYRMGEKGSRTETNLPLLLRSQNEIGRPGLGQWLGQAVFGMATVGNAVGWILETDGMGFPSVVRWLGWNEWNFDEANKTWHVRATPVPSSRIVHIPWIVPPGRTLGLSPIDHYASLVRAGLSAQDYADLKRGGGLPPALLKNSEKILNPEEARAAQSRAVASFSSGKPFVTGRDWDLTLMTIPPNYAQFIETLNLTAVQIAAIYGIDEREIGGRGGDSMTYKTDESIQLNRANNLRPYIVRIEDAISRLLPERQFVKLNIDSTIRTDIKTRFEIYQAELAMGTRSVNEVRALEDRPPVEGGDFFNVPTAYTPPKAPNLSGNSTMPGATATQGEPS